MRKLAHIIGLCLVTAMMAVPAPVLAAETVQLELNKGRMVRLARTAATVMIADPNVADIQVVSPRMVYVHAKKIGDTSLYAIDANDETILDATIEVTHNISKLERSAKELVPNADVAFKSVDGGLVVKGYTDSPAESENIRSLASTFMGTNDKLVNMLTTAGSDQVTLMVKVAEVSRNELKRFGINLASAFNPGNFAFSLLQGRTFLDATNAVTRTGNDNSIFGSYTRNNFNINGIIDALETQGLVTTLAEPSLTTTSGKTANFLAGGEFPIPIVSGNGEVSVEYKPFGISLNFTPIVLSKEKISLTVAPEVSSISSVDELTLGASATFAIPSIQTRRAETTVELGSGQTFAIAGLLKNDRSNSVDKFPGLGDMPVLGALFRSQEFQNDQTELVILVTPFIVRPVSDRAKIQSPLDGYVPPTDLARMMLGQLYTQQSVPSEGGENNMTVMPEKAPKLYGNGGFILE